MTKEDCALLVRAARMAREEFTRLDKLDEEGEEEEEREEDEEEEEDDDGRRRRGHGEVFSE